MRSVVVVLPASMWAMMPMFLQRSNVMVLGTFLFFPWVPVYKVLKIFVALRLPAIVGKSLVGFRHAVHVFLLLDRPALAVGGVEQFVGQLIDHALFAAFARIADEPAD